MPKYCSVPNCRNESGSGGERRSFYRFPLQEPLRLQQWLRNMGREGWTPSRHQYICHQHFAPSCFRVRWGIRYIEKNAVPTVFQEAEKRKASDCGERSPKRRRDDCDLSAASDDGSVASPAAALLCDGAVDPFRTGDDRDASLQTDVDTPPLVDDVQAGVHVPLALFQREEELSNGEEDAEVVVVSGFPAGGDGQEELLNAVILPPGHRLVFGEPTGEAVTLSGVEEVAYGAEELSQGHATQLIAYYETPADAFPCEAAAQFTLCPQTVLSSALSSTPIASTLPIVSKHAAPSPPSLVLTVERLDADGGDGDEDRSEEEDAELQDQQLEEHCYHKNSLSKEQLEAVVSELQKKVKVLQQRHRRHLDKLLGLESTVSQLRQSNLLNEERLQLLERAYIQSSTAVSDAGETVAIIYEEDDGAAAYLYTPLNGVETEL